MNSDELSNSASSSVHHVSGSQNSSSSPTREYIYIDHSCPLHLSGDPLSNEEKEHYHHLTTLVKGTLHGDGQLQTDRPDGHELHNAARRTVHHHSFFTPECRRRYLIAQKWNPKKSYEAMLKTICWREENVLKPFHEECLVRCHQSRYSEWCGHDREGRPCMFIKSTNADLSIPREERLQYLTIMLEKGLSLMKEPHSGKEGVEQWNMIVDETDKGYCHMDNKFVSNVGPILFDHYVERLHKCYVINPGFLTQVVVGVIKLFVDDRTSSKIRMIDSKKLPGEILSPSSTVSNSSSSVGATFSDASSPLSSAASPAGTTPKVFQGLTDTDGVTPYVPSSFESVERFVPDLIKDLGPQAVPIGYGGTYELPSVLQYLQRMKRVAPVAVDA